MFFLRICTHTNLAKLDIINKKRYKTCSNPENRRIKGTDLIMSKLDKEQVIAAFTEAYTAANGKAPTIEAKGGWYSVDTGKNIRLADLDAMIAELGASTPSKEVTADVEKPKKVAVAPLKKKAKKSDFSVKAFWVKKILKESTVSKLPR
ncbi:MAG: hypothetical protein ACI936_004113 [Paraglaciecola sp.]